MSLQNILQAITSTPQPITRADASHLADDARNIMAALLVRPSADVRHMIELFAPIAEAFLQDLIAGRIPEASLALRAKYASLSLARAGYGPIHNVRTLHANLTKEDIESIKERAVRYASDPSLRNATIPLHTDVSHTDVSHSALPNQRDDNTTK